VSLSGPSMDATDPLRNRLATIVHAWLTHLAMNDEEFEMVAGKDKLRMTMATAAILQVLIGDDARLGAATKRITTLLQRRDLAVGTVDIKSESTPKFEARVVRDGDAGAPPLMDRRSTLR